MNKTVYLVLLGIIISFNLHSQMPVGSWQTHLAYTAVTQVAESHNKVFGFADGSLYSYDKEGNEVKTYSKITGLSDNTIRQIAYNKDQNLLFIAYENANIDLLMNDGIVNIPDFMNTVRSGDKTIYNIYFSQNLAYLSTGIGIVVVDMVKREIPATYRLEKDKVTLPIYGVTEIGSEIFASTSNGLYKANKSDNLLDYQNWKLIEGSPVGTQLVEFQGELCLLKISDGVYRYANSTWSKLVDDTNVNYLAVSNRKLLAVAPWAIYSYDSPTNRNIISGLSSVSASVYSIDNNGTYWVASGDNGLVCVKGDGTVVTTGIKPDGPATNRMSEVLFSPSYDKLYVVSGGPRRYSKGNIGYIMGYDGSDWTFIRSPYNDMIGMSIDPRNPNHFFVGTWQDGLLEYENNELKKRYYKDGWIDDVDGGGIAWVCGTAYDKDANLWMINVLVQNGIKVLTKDGTHKSLYFSNLSKREATKILITSFGQKWIISDYKSYTGVIILDDKGELKDQSSGASYKDYLKFYDQDGNLADAANYYSIVEDRNGAIWIGTDRGPIIFNNVKNNPDIAFSSNLTCTRIKIPRNDGTNLADYLLDGERINAIAVDGGNRKWIGTTNSGLYLVSADGLQTIHHFTSENSPLLSNNIFSLAVNPNTGEVFIGTDKGVISYQGDAIEGKSDFSNVYVYPNPVRPDYTGIISVTGLVENANVKITDISGNLICEGVSQGGQFSWNGKNRNGERVSTGVYLVYGSNSDGSQSVVSKIMLVK